MSSENLTLLWTSHGFVMADRSHAVIIIALQEKQNINKMISSLHISYKRRKKPSAFFFFLWSIRSLHDDLLPGGVVGDVADFIFLVWNSLHRIHDLLEHRSLPGSEENKSVIFPESPPKKAKRRPTDVNVLEIKGEVSRDDANFKQMLHGLKLALLQVLEDIQVLERPECD